MSSWNSVPLVTMSPVTTAMSGARPLAARDHAIAHDLGVSVPTCRSDSCAMRSPSSRASSPGMRTSCSTTRNQRRRTRTPYPHTTSPARYVHMYPPMGSDTGPPRTSSITGTTTVSTTAGTIVHTAAHQWMKYGMSTKRTNASLRRRSGMPARARPRKSATPAAPQARPTSHAGDQPRRRASSVTPRATGTCIATVMATRMRKKRDIRSRRRAAYGALCSMLGLAIVFRSWTSVALDEPALRRRSLR